jgi:hypothetical protein
MVTGCKLKFFVTDFFLETALLSPTIIVHRLSNVIEEHFFERWEVWYGLGTAKMG